VCDTPNKYEPPGFSAVCHTKIPCATQIIPCVCDTERKLSLCATQKVFLCVAQNVFCAPHKEIFVRHREISVCHRELVLCATHRERSLCAAQRVLCATHRNISVCNTALYPGGSYLFGRPLSFVRHENTKRKNVRM
jgi:hypothetical protein